MLDPELEESPGVRGAQPILPFILKRVYPSISLDQRPWTSLPDPEVEVRATQLSALRSGLSDAERGPDLGIHSGLEMVEGNRGRHEAPQQANINMIGICVPNFALNQ